MASRIIQPRSLSIPQRGMRKPSRPVLDLAHPLSHGLVGCWLLGDTTNNGVARDISSSGINGVFVAGPILSDSHHGGLSSHFTAASSQYANLGLSPILQPAAFTACGWIKPTSLAASYSAVYSFIDSTGSFLFYRQLLLKSTGKLACFIVAGVGLSYDGTGANTLSTNVWYFVGISYDTSNGLRGWVNGSIDATVSPNGAIVIGTNTNTTLGNDLVTAGRALDGNVEGWRLYNRVLAQSEMQRLYSEPYAGIYEAGQFNRVGIAAGAPPWFQQQQNADNLMRQIRMVRSGP